ncbi:LysR substrate-binding domain-containing protein [Inquilinus sp. CA228]|uniref:LysR substrate-binding domain-containing protein n=1 Tax=Inquilinus sp. CA228 TaxID=3455609 RepID=UPI003F8D027E
MKRLDSHTVEVFRAVVEAGSATHAAASLGITQPAVTRVISGFEKHCGFRLFERGRFGMRLTPDGRVIYEEAQRSVVGLDRLQRCVASVRDGVGAMLSLGLVATLAEGRMGQRLGDYIRRTPGLHVQIAVDPPSRIVNDLLLGRCDAGIICGAYLADPRVEVTVLGRRALAAVMVPDHPLAQRPRLEPSDLARVPLIHLEQSDPLRRLLDGAFARAGVVPNVVGEVSTQRAAATIASGSAGVALVEMELAAQMSPLGLVSVPLWDVGCEVLAIMLRSKIRTAVLDRLLNWIARPDDDADQPDFDGHGSGDSAPRKGNGWQPPPTDVQAAHPD